MGVADSRYKTATAVSLELTTLRIKQRYPKITTQEQFT